MFERIMEMMARAGAERYGNEAVSQLEHALQCAMHAERTGGDAALITASLLHDIGHLVDDPDENAAARGIDLRHEEVGADWLSAVLPPEVTEPIRLHVAAKRYLCHAETGYWQALSPASKESLAVQGGPFTADEARVFLDLPHAAAAVRLRRFDEAGKAPRLKTPTLEYYGAFLRQVMRV